MKVCRNCKENPRYPDSVPVCKECAATLEDLTEEDTRAALVSSATRSEPAIPNDESDKCPECGVFLTPDMPLCINGHPVQAVERTPDAAACDLAATKSQIVPWIEIAGVEVSCRAGDVIGRAGTLRKDLFSAYGTVSGQHCAVHFVDDRWLLQRLPSGRNPTFLDGKPVQPGELVPLTGTHLLQMSSQCAVRISLKPAQT